MLGIIRQLMRSQSSFYQGIKQQKARRFRRAIQLTKLNTMVIKWNKTVIILPYRF